MNNVERLILNYRETERKLKETRKSVKRLVGRNDCKVPGDKTTIEGDEEKCAGATGNVEGKREKGKGL